MVQVPKLISNSKMDERVQPAHFMRLFHMTLIIKIYCKMIFLFMIVLSMCLFCILYFTKVLGSFGMRIVIFKTSVC